MKALSVTKLALAGALLFGTLAACHSTYYDSCKSQQECFGGNDKDIDACVDQARASEEIAEAYDCEDPFDKLVQCVKDKGNCKTVGNTKTYDTSGCKAESDAFSSCQAAASGKKK
jgi:hypothetical protein